HGRSPRRDAVGVGVAVAVAAAAEAGVGISAASATLLLHRVEEFDRAFKAGLVHFQAGHLAGFEFHDEPAGDGHVGRGALGFVAPALLVRAIALLMLLDGVVDAALSGLDGLGHARHAGGFGHCQARNRVVVADPVGL